MIRSTFMRIVAIILFQLIFCVSLIFAQNTGTSATRLLIQLAAQRTEMPPVLHRGEHAFKSRSRLGKINPLNLFASGLLFFYQQVLSEQIQAKCNYELTCSSYTRVSIEKYGLIKGSLLGLSQMSSCVHGIAQDYPPFMISPEYKIRNGISF